MLCMRDDLSLAAILLSFGIVGGGGGDGGCTAISSGGGGGGNGDGGDCSRIVADNDGNDRVV